MITLTTTIQEITMQAYAFGVYDILFNQQNLGRDVVFNTFEEWGREFETAHEGYDWDGDYYDEIDNFVLAKKAELQKWED